jgi:hypothetical protein
MRIEIEIEHGTPIPIIILSESQDARINATVKNVKESLQFRFLFTHFTLFTKNSSKIESELGHSWNSAKTAEYIADLSELESYSILYKKRTFWKRHLSFWVFRLDYSRS